MVEQVGSTPIDQTVMLKRCHTTAGISALLVLSLTWRTVESKKCQESLLPMEECRGLMSDLNVKGYILTQTIFFCQLI